MDSEEIAAAIKKLEDRIESLQYSTSEKFLELDRENNTGVIMVSGKGLTPRFRGEKLFFTVQNLLRKVLNLPMHPSEVTTIGRFNSNRKAPIIVR